MDNQTRLEATKAVWTAVAIILVAMFISAGIWGSGLEVGHGWLGIFIAMAGMGSTSFIWSDKNNTSEQVASTTEKAKRERIDSVLRDLSDEDLLRLKQRLSDGTIDDDYLHEHMTLSDDGELIPMERN